MCVHGEVIKLVAGEVDINHGRVLFESQADDDAWAKEELVLDVVRLRVLRLVEELQLRGVGWVFC